MGLLIGLAWVILWIWDRSPYGRYLHHAQLGELGLGGSPLLAIVLYLLGWTLMTAAMMLPTTLPLLEIFRRLVMRRPDRWQLMAGVITGCLARLRHCRPFSRLGTASSCRTQSLA
jgi:predicted metal-binding membrane protein